MYDDTNHQPQLTPATVDEFVRQYRDRISRNTSRVFAVLMLLQWLGAIITAVIVSPRTWTGTSSSIHAHVWAAFFLGGIITVLPVALAMVYPTRPLTRHMIAAGQMLMSALLIHLTGGRVETHFHVFGGLAILAFYRDWRILITASVIVYLDHVLRGLYWPQSVYGVLNASPWRAVEHAWWVGFEVLFLIIAIRQSVREMHQIAERQVKLHALNSKIEAEVRDRTAELSTINKQMETFCYSMSHDLKAPLRGIHSFSQILVQDHGDMLDAEARQCVARIQDSASKMNRLVNDLLEYSRVSRAKLPLTPIDLSTVAEEAVRLLGSEIQDRHASITVQPGLGVVLGHEATLVQVMLNLLGNALRYSKPGVPAAIQVQSESSGHRIRISVQDQGIGIAPEYHQKIFEIFERVPTAGNQGGTGIGLAIVAKCIERLAGTLGLESKPDEGSTFWFELPVAQTTSSQVRLGSETTTNGWRTHQPSLNSLAASAANGA